MFIKLTIVKAETDAHAFDARAVALIRAEHIVRVLETYNPQRPGVKSVVIYSPSPNAEEMPMYVAETVGEIELALMGKPMINSASP